MLKYSKGYIIDRGDYSYEIIEKVDGKLVVECSVCSKDDELYPKGSLSLNPRKIYRQETPCGCGKVTNFNSNQYKVLLRRKFKQTTGYSLVTDIDTVELKAKTKIALMDNYTSEIINREVKTVLQDSFKSKVERLEDNKESYLVKKGIRSFHERGTEFFRDPINSKVWYYKCGKCSYDNYVKSGVCNGTFKIDISHLSAGRKSCRCSSAYKWSIPEREVQLRALCRKRNHVFNGWIDLSKTTSHCRFNWTCELGHLCEVSVDNYIRGKGCKHCAISTGNGYFPSRRTESDFLYVMKIVEDGHNPKSYFKVGRSFFPERRMKELSKEVKKKDDRCIKFSPVIYLKGTHGEVFKLEQEIHNVFKDYKPTDGYGSSELIHNRVFMEVLGYLKATQLPLVISESFYDRVKHEIGMNKDNLCNILDNLSGLTEDNIEYKLLEYFEEKVWKRAFNYTLTEEETTDDE